MPSRKQRRRREKTFRHDYVWEDEEGNEAARLAEIKPEVKKEKTAKAATATGRQSGRTGLTGRAGKVIQPPSWRRVGKRALIFAPFMFIAVSLLDHKLNATQHALQTLFLLAFFLPFSYVMDTIAYRMYLKRTGQTPATKKPAAKS